MLDFLENNAQGHYFYYLALISSVILLILWKKQRKHFVIPAFIMGLIIANPWFKDLWTNVLHILFYWRVLWIVPVIPICAALPAFLCEKVKNDNLKGGIALIMAVVFVLAGSCVYQYRSNTFIVPSPNADKLPEEAIEVADTLLTMDESPKIVGDRDITIYVRQYTGKIETLYGRDIDGYIVSYSIDGTIQTLNPYAWRVKEALENKKEDLSFLALMMIEEGYEYLVTKADDSERETELRNCHFELVNQTEGWNIYRPVTSQ